MGIDAIPPPASGPPARLVLGPALRAQSDGRLVRLVREGYESAFEEIVRRYRRPLDRFAASIVGGRSEDVTQDSFRKALEALRGCDAEVELRPWLYRIVRNTALNDLRDRPPAAAELAEELVGGGRSAAVEAERREEVETLVARLRALPERQRAALVMRELEGMGHEEIAAALGISGGAARQAIARGRAAVRGGFGALVPLPLVRALASGDPGLEGATGAGAGALAGGAGGAGALGTAGASAGLLGGGALKVGLATIAVAGSLGAGVAIQHHDRGTKPRPATRAAASKPGGAPSVAHVRPTPSPAIAEVDDHRDSGRGSDHGGGDQSGRGGGRHGDDGHGDDRHIDGRRDQASSSGPSGSDLGAHDDGSGNGGPGPSEPTTGGSRSSGRGGDDGSSDRHRSSGSGDSGTRGGSGSGSDSGSSSGSHSGSGGSGSDGESGTGSSGSTSGGHGSDDPAEPVAEASAPASGSSGGPGPSSGSSTSGGGDDTSSSTSGSSGGPSPSVESPVTTDDGSGGGPGPSGGGSGSSGDSEISP